MVLSPSLTHPLFPVCRYGVRKKSRESQIVFFRAHLPLLYARKISITYDLQREMDDI